MTPKGYKMIFENVQKNENILNNPPQPIDPILIQNSKVDISKKMYRRGDILGATFCWWPLAAIWMIYKNFQVLWNQDEARKVIWQWSIFFFVVMMIVVYAPDELPNWLIPMIYTAGIISYFNKYQNYFVVEHFKKWGNKCSLLNSILVALLWFISIFAFLFLWGFVTVFLWI